MTVVIGPVLKRADGYEFDTWTAGKEVARGYPYRRIEDAYYARNADIKASAQGRAPAAIVCQTLDEFIVKLTEDGYPINDVYLAAKTPWLQRQLRNPLGLVWLKPRSSTSAIAASSCPSGVVRTFRPWTR